MLTHDPKLAPRTASAFRRWVIQAAGDTEEGGAQQHDSDHSCALSLDLAGWLYEQYWQGSQEKSCQGIEAIVLD